MSGPPSPLMTLEQYFELEETSEVRHEFFRGERFAMAGGTLRHALAISNCTVSLSSRLAGKPYIVLASNMRTMAGELVTYPDIEVICDKPQMLRGRKDTVSNPTVVIEVLSPSTERYDRGLKAQQYRSMASLRDLLFVSQSEPRVELYSRDGDAWRLSEAVGMDASIRIPSLDCAIPLAEIYRMVDFDDDDAPKPTRD